MNKMRIVAIACAILTLSIGSGIAYYFIHQNREQHQTIPQIVDFQDERDTKAVLDIFAVDHYWLYASKDYDPAYALKTRSPNAHEEKYKGKLIIKVLRTSSELIGFVAYYMKNFVEGMVLFLAVKDAHRGKGYGPQLMNYALDQLKQLGAKTAQLITRVSNTKAQSVYNKVGFTELGRDSEYVYYGKLL